MEQQLTVFATAMGLSFLMVVAVAQATPMRASQTDPQGGGQPAAALKSNSQKDVARAPEQNAVLPDLQDFDQDGSGAVKATHRSIRTDTNDPVVQLVDFPRG